MKCKLDSGAFMPTRAHDTDAGLDLRTPITVTVPARGSAIIDTGVHIAIPFNTVGIIKSKSGLNVKHGLTSDGVIDEGYTGSIVAKIINHSDKDYTFNRGDKIVQFVVFPVKYPELELVDELEPTERGDNGFGSTGW